MSLDSRVRARYRREADHAHCVVRSNFFAMPPSGQAAGSKKSDPNEAGIKPTFNFGLARK